MNIVGIEVIRGNPVLATEVVTGETVQLNVGDTLRVFVSLDYRGQAQTATLYGAIGSRLPVIGFDELLVGESSLPLPDSPIDFTPVEGSIDIEITAIGSGTYDLYCKIKEYLEAGLPEVSDVIGITGEYELIQHTIYHFAYIYDGDVEVTTATFKIDPFTPSAWAAKEFADALESEARKKGARVLETKVYVDTTPLLWTNIRIEVTGTPLGGAVGAAHGIAVGIPVWLAIILVALAIIAVIVIATLMWERFQESFKTKPGLEDVKVGWGKEALILDIQDAEEYWERTPTPVETLEGMSEEELRHVLNQMAEEEVTPEVSWLPLVVIGGLGVLGVGAAIALATRKE